MLNRIIKLLHNVEFLGLSFYRRLLVPFDLLDLEVWQHLLSAPVKVNKHRQNQYNYLLRMGKNRGGGGWGSKSSFNILIMRAS